MQREIQDAILSYESPSDVGQACPCARGGRRFFRCHDCPLHPPVCSSCLLEAHPYEPLHWGEVWTGKCFRKIDLSDLGKRIYLGHGGLRCPALRESSTGVKMTTIDTNGVHKAFVVYCECSDNMGPHSQVQQLLRGRLFPYTTDTPETVVTFRCLRDFHVHTNASRKSAHDYIKALLRMTSEDSRIKTSVRCFSCISSLHVLIQHLQYLSQHFIRLMRLWRFLAAERESGQTMAIDNLMTFRPAGSFADVCLACPLPDVNMTEATNEQETPKWPICNVSDRHALNALGPRLMK